MTAPVASAAHAPTRATIGRSTPAWGIGSHALSSAGNLVLSLVAVRLLSSEGFGAVAVGTAVVYLALAAGRALVGEPLLMRPEQVDDAGATGAAVALGAAGGTVLLASAALVGGVVAGPLAVVGVALPAVLAQDALRYVASARGRGRRAFTLDAVWFVVQAAVLAVHLARGSAGPVDMMTAWAAGALASAVVGMAASGIVPSLRGARSWFHEHRRTGRDLVVEMGATMGVWHLILAFLGAVVGLSASGAIRAVQVLFGPLHVLNAGLRFVLVPAAVQDAAPEGREATAWQASRRSTVVLGGLAIVWLSALMVLPDAAGQKLLMASWAEGRALVLPFGLFMVSQGLVAAAAIGHRVLGATGESRRSALLSSMAILIAGIVGGILGSVLVVTWLLAGAGIISVAVWVTSLARTCRPPTRLGGRARLIPREAP